MKNIKKITTILSLLLLLGCGYQPIYSNKNDVNNYFSIENVVFVKQKSFNKLILNKLRNYIDSDNKIKKFSLNIDIAVNKSVKSKNKQGNPEIYSLNIVLNLNVFENNISKSNVKFNENFEYSNQSNKFNLKQYENNIQTNLLNKISEDIIKHLYAL